MIAAEDDAFGGKPMSLRRCPRRTGESPTGVIAGIAALLIDLIAGGFDEDRPALACRRAEALPR